MCTHRSEIQSRMIPKASPRQTWETLPLFVMFAAFCVWTMGVHFFYFLPFFLSFNFLPLCSSIRCVIEHKQFCIQIRTVLYVCQFCLDIISHTSIHLRHNIDSCLIFFFVLFFNTSATQNYTISHFIKNTEMGGGFLFSLDRLLSRVKWF